MEWLLGQTGVTDLVTDGRPAVPVLDVPVGDVGDDAGS